MFPAAPSGLVNCNATKVLLLLTVFLSVMSSTFNFHHLLNLNRNALGSLQFWRLISHHFLFKNSGEMLVALIMTYYFRVFERQMGTSIFTAYLVALLAFSTLFEMSLLYLVDFAKISFEGSYALLFGLLVFYWTDIPPSYRFTIVGFGANDKLFIYMFALHLFYSSVPTTGLHALCGTCAGLIVHNGFFSSSKLVASVAKLINSFIPKSERTYQTTINTSQPADVNADANPQPPQAVQGQQAQPGPQAVDNLRRFQQYLQQQQQQMGQQNIPVNAFQQQLQQFMAQQQQMQQGGAQGQVPQNNNNVFAQPPMQVQPTQENIEYLTNMGFPREEATRALALNQNHIESALTTLLGQ